MIIRLFSLACILLLMACNQPGETEAVAEDKPAAVQPVTPSAAAVKNKQPGGDLPYPVYTKFEQLAPLFQQDNDTTYVINFWATWCKPCVEEMPYFEQLATEVADQPVRIVMVSLDFAKEVRGKLLTFVKERPLDLPIIALLDHRYNEWIDQVDPRWSGAIPITVIYKGKEREFVEEQFESYNQLADIVKRISS